ncbi:MAG: adenosine deaminase [Planctomycetes bacterium]|nr:adenosine deaminase [Planctomycetota bacterium]MCW8134091.1 adenosine deaminase [Planctomycetota bacterium]
MAIDFTGLPKTELHIHLEGAIPVESVFTLVRKYGRLSEAPDIEAVRRRYEFDDFAHFLESYRWTVSFLQSPDDYEYVAYEVAGTLARQNVWFTEIMVGLGSGVMDVGHDSADIVRAAWRGLKAAEVQFGIRARLQVATGRQHGVEFAQERLRDIEPLLGEVDICAFNVAGAEHTHPLPQYRGLFERARAMGLRTTMHAGEVSGPGDVYDALDMGAERIGHGIKSALDPQLMAELVRRDIALEVCPVSNEATGAITRLADHPLPRLLRAGVPVTLSSDDPAMFHTSVAREYEVAHEVLGVDCPTLVRIAREGFKRGFMDEPLRAALLARFDAQARAWCAARDVQYPA